MRFSPKLWCLFGVHEYKLFKEGKVRFIHRDGTPDGTSGVFYHFQCGVCGRFKEKRA